MCQGNTGIREVYFRNYRTYPLDASHWNSVFEWEGECINGHRGEISQQKYPITESRFLGHHGSKIREKEPDAPTNTWQMRLTGEPGHGVVLGNEKSTVAVVVSDKIDLSYLRQSSCFFLPCMCQDRVY